MIFEVEERCGRLTFTTKAACKSFAKFAGSCPTHLTASEKVGYRRVVAIRKRQEMHERQERDATVPACWTWPHDAEANYYHALPILKADGREAAFDAATYLLSVWQQGRCGICGRRSRGDMTLDHDHDTGWIRGYLCRSCNVSEGRNGGALFRRYRERHPASIFGFGVLYCGPWVDWAETRVDYWDPVVHRALERTGGAYTGHVEYDETGRYVRPPRWHLFGGRDSKPCPTTDRVTRTCACAPLSA